MKDGQLSLVCNNDILTLVMLNILVDFQPMYWSFNWPTDLPTAFYVNALITHLFIPFIRNQLL
jgi:hypothetical protein